MPILIYTDTPWEEYLRSLSHGTRYEWRLVSKKFAHLTYSRWEFEKEPVRKFIEIWDSQIHCGCFYSYIMTADMFEKEKDKWMFFAAKDRDKIIAIHPVRIFDDSEIKFISLHTPLYDKNEDHDIAEYMWFNLIKYAIENHLPILDFVGAGSWRENIKHRSGGVHYKWKFVPDWVKDNPDAQPDYIREIDKMFLSNETK